MTLPLAVISFNRPDYLVQTLDSLRRQAVAAERIALFQDGPRKPSDEQLITDCVKIFVKLFPKGTVFYSRDNLGPGLNIARAESWLFENLDTEAGAIFEDDMIVSPHYLEILQAMLGANCGDDRIAYVAAYGPVLPEPPGDEPYAPMHLNWAFALTRHQWLKRKPLVDAYLDILRRSDYRDRDMVGIMQLRERWGLPGPYTTQDVMRAAATYKVGGIRLNTRQHYARYIGARGLHIDQKAYDAVGFSKWPIADGIPNFKPVSEAMVRRCQQRAEEFIGTGSAAA